MPKPNSWNGKELRSWASGLPKNRKAMTYLLCIGIPSVIESVQQAMIEDAAMLHGLAPALAGWALLGRVELFLIAWGINEIIALLASESTTETVWKYAAVALLVAGTTRAAIWVWKKLKEKQEEPWIPKGWCETCKAEIQPVRPPFPAGWCALAVSLTGITIIMFGGTTWWFVMGFVLWRTVQAVCPRCEQDPIAGNAGFTKEMAMMWIATSVFATWFFIAMEPLL